MEGLSCRIKERIQPFERRLALQELRALAGGPVVPLDGDDATASTFSVACASDAGALREALAYWHSVGDRADGTTTQLRAEAALEFARHDAAGDGLPEILRARLLAKTSGKRRLRYATHGLHEYRGKFFPQLVRALMNIARLPDDAVVLDPMCGSGTTLVEARLSGRTAWGLDMNPLSVFIADVKCRALALEPSALTEACDQLRRVLDTDAPPVGAPPPRRHGRRGIATIWTDGSPVARCGNSTSSTRQCGGFRPARSGTSTGSVSATSCAGFPGRRTTICGCGGKRRTWHPARPSPAFSTKRSARREPWRPFCPNAEARTWAGTRFTKPTPAVRRTRCPPSPAGWTP